ncbi:sperm acrosome-associated protein 9-like isoform X2 [Convolutriloba macropyga]|uniref:sperm acrosome-associated protein 9-like isoform X2 n=1 Tax=Convolutriloba macropyga TaxID=536237 RepID=UPI003F528F0E
MSKSKGNSLTDELAEIEKKYFLFKKKLNTFVEALNFYRCAANSSHQPLRTVEQMESLLNQATQHNATYKGVIKLWFDVYDELRALIHKQVLAAQQSAPDVTDEVLKIRVTESLEYVNELTQPTYDVIENELDQKLKAASLEDMRHDELYQTKFEERRLFGPMLCLLPVALDALAHANKLNSTLISGARSAIQSRQQQQQQENNKKSKSSASSVVSRSTVGSRGSCASSNMTSSSSKPPWRPSGPVTPQIRKTSSIL